MQPVAEALAERLRILGQPVRIRLIAQLDYSGEQPVGVLAQALDERLQNVSQHLGILRSAGVVSRRYREREVWYQLTDPTAMRVYELVASGLLAESERLKQVIDGRD